MTLDVAPPHESAVRHVTGRAVYIDDIVEPKGALDVYVAQSTEAHARVIGLDLSKTKTAPGVVAVIAARDVPGVNDVGPVKRDDPIFADGLVQYRGQSLFAVAATSIEAARRAAALAEVRYEKLPAILTVEEALAAKSFLMPSERMARGDASSAIAAAPHRLSGRLVMGGQDHFYLEGQVALALPGEGGAMIVHASTQHPSEVQHLVARALGRPDASVTVEVRRMGGGFGGKETQASLFAVIAALCADKTGRPAKLRLDRDDDMIMTGKRHDFVIRYEVGFDGEGRVLGIRFEQAARGGYSTDLTSAIADRAMFHADNCYWLPHVEIVSHRLKTNTVSNTAFRGFGGPQGMLGIEHVMDEIARSLGREPLDVRRVNFYGKTERNVTPFGMTVEDNVAPDIVDDLAASADYRRRREAHRAFNAASPIVKRGLALTPVRFGISFTATHFNQAGALVHVYQDGSVHLNHGGAEMGQGLFVKIAQVVAREFGIGLDRIAVSPTNTGKVPNTSATAASSGSDLNGMAARDAARTIKGRMAAVAADAWGIEPDAVIFQNGVVSAGGRSMTFAELAKKTYMARVQLSATGYYRTPKIGYDRATFSGRPFYYFAYGAAASEVEIDTLTGEYRIVRADILHDVGSSLNPAIDIGQIEGGYVQGAGWLTTEELVWDTEGRLLTHAPSTYKIPAASDAPADFRVRLFPGHPNREDTIHRSKAVGEPPFMLGISVFLALRDAVAACGKPGCRPPLDAPATPERVLFAVEAVR